MVTVYIGIVASSRLSLGKPLNVSLVLCSLDTIDIMCVGWLSAIPGQHIQLYADIVEYVAALCQRYGICQESSQRI